MITMSTRIALPVKFPTGETVGIPGDFRFTNHYIFGGTRDFSELFRDLVAGSGTGDAVIGLGRADLYRFIRAIPSDGRGVS